MLASSNKLEFGSVVNDWKGKEENPHFEKKRESRRGKRMSKSKRREKYTRLVDANMRVRKW